MQLTCFACNATGSIEAFTRDEAAGELVALAGSLPPSLWRALMAYIGLFRTSRKISFDKALKLAKETLALDTDTARLEIALGETVEALRAKNGPPLKNHNYLKRVLENQGPGTRNEGPVTAFTNPQPPIPGPRNSKAAQAIAALEEWSGGEWLRQRIAGGLAACVAQALKFTPAVEMITLNADTWYLALKTKLTIEEIDAPRITRGFELLLPRLTEWPKPAQLLDILPPRPRRELLRHEPTAEERERGREKARKLKEEIGIT